MADLKETHPFIATYLRYIENTETPRLHHIWAALSGVSACMGRRCWFPQAVGEVFPNMFIAIVGPPAVRKSTALKMMAGLIRENTGVRFAPDDTGGQRQGIIAAMNDYDLGQKDSTKLLEEALTAGSAEDASSMAGLARMNNAMEALASVEIDARDPRTMFVCQTELKAFLGENNTQMTTFLCKMYDGDPYDYRLKSSSHTLTNALLSILGCTTPTEISLSLPHEAIGGGFTSRIVFVYAGSVYRKIPRPTVDDEASKIIGDTFRHIYNDMSGAFNETPDAAAEWDNIYMRGITLKDPRFVNYVDRRDSTHLRKLAMVLAASRKSMTIEVVDVKAADQLLMLTEETMSDALGEYGMSPLSAAKQKLLEFIRHSTGPIPDGVLWGMMAKDMKAMDYKMVIDELANTKKIKKITVPTIGICIVATDQSKAKRAKAELNILAALLQMDTPDA